MKYLSFLYVVIIMALLILGTAIVNIDVTKRSSTPNRKIVASHVKSALTSNNAKLVTSPSVKIYAITSTYKRPEQKAELTRLSHMIKHIPSFHWVVIEDSKGKTPLVSNFLKKSGLNVTHLCKKNGKRIGHGPKDLLTRNFALNWVRNHLARKEKGIVYFMDDDNTYDLRLFEEMRTTKIAAVWPVGLVGKVLYEGPVVCRGERVQKWRTGWKVEKRKFKVDMAGFCVHTDLLLQKPDVTFKDVATLEDDFLVDLGLTPKTIEGKHCDEVLVWHTRTEVTNISHEKYAIARYNATLIEV
nr:galactosylgalactosylxylosylprotein 3-beta-glucuronosyltransferase 2 [Ciona intestinalis]|eukprot:XP_002120667.3 galactosylgalactosylxylosylprotein 3-beta-glucuronosyltransferase 2 [Ciona intestinalis]